MWGIDWVQVWAFWHTAGALIFGVGLFVIIVLVVLVQVYVVDPIRGALARRRAHRG